jgi:hypothetical protein
MRSLRTALPWIALLLLPWPALAQDEPIPQPPSSPAPAAVPAVDPTAHRHLGLFVHFDLGAGYFRSWASTSGVEASISGPAVPVGIAVGGAVSENWILAGEVWGSLAPSPKLTFGGSSSSADDSTVTVEGVGLALTHYFMPANVYLTLTPAITLLSNRTGDTTASTDYGFGAKLAVGKEWWVGNHWGLGVGVQVLVAVNKDKGSNSPTWTTLGGGVTFSATYN